MIIATWCQREDTPETPFSDKERADLDFLYEEWAHPHFISYQEYGRLMEVSTCRCCSNVPDNNASALPSRRLTRPCCGSCSFSTIRRY